MFTNEKKNKIADNTRGYVYFMTLDNSTIYPSFRIFDFIMHFTKEELELRINYLQFLAKKVLETLEIYKKENLSKCEIENVILGKERAIHLLDKESTYFQEKLKELLSQK